MKLFAKYDIRFFLLPLLAVGLFQNCAENLDPNSYDTNSSSMGSEVTPTPTVGVAPAINKLQTPTAISAKYLESLTIPVLVTGSNLTFKWYKNGQEIKGQSGSNFFLPSAKEVDAGLYSLVVTNPSGGDAVDINVSVNRGAEQHPPKIADVGKVKDVTVAMHYLNNAHQWTKVNGSTGSTVKFAVSSSSILPVTYRWYFISSATGEKSYITGANRASYSFQLDSDNSYAHKTKEISSRSGIYGVEVRNDYGVVKSEAKLTLQRTHTKSGRVWLRPILRELAR